MLALRFNRFYVLLKQCILSKVLKLAAAADLQSAKQSSNLC